MRTEGVLAVHETRDISKRTVNELDKAAKKMYKEAVEKLIEGSYGNVGKAMRILRGANALALRTGNKPILKAIKKAYRSAEKMEPGALNRKLAEIGDFGI